MISCLVGITQSSSNSSAGSSSISLADSSPLLSISIGCASLVCTIPVGGVEVDALVDVVDSAAATAAAAASGEESLCSSAGGVVSASRAGGWESLVPVRVGTGRTPGT